MDDQLTPEELAELRSLYDAAAETDNLAALIRLADSIPLLIDKIKQLTQELEESERERVRFTDLYVEARSEIGDLRRERETLAAAVRGWQRYLEKDLGTGRVHALVITAHEEAFSLLDDQKDRQAERNLAVAVEQVLKAWDMGDDLEHVMDALREAALDHARFQSGGDVYDIEVGDKDG